MSRHSEIGKRIVKYALEGLMVAFAALIIPQKLNSSKFFQS